MSFIENLTADSLNLPAEEFERYVTGQAVPPGGYDQGASEGLRVMYSNLAMLSDLRQRQERLAAGALYLRQEIIGFRVSIIRYFRNNAEDVFIARVIGSDIRRHCTLCAGLFHVYLSAPLGDVTSKVTRFKSLFKLRGAACPACPAVSPNHVLCATLRSLRLVFLCYSANTRKVFGSAVPVL